MSAKITPNFTNTSLILHIELEIQKVDGSDKCIFVEGETIEDEFLNPFY